MKIYGISGLGADERVFQYLNLSTEIIPINWLTPHKNESLEQYSLRLSKSINTNEEFGLLGVSFGGVIATEISKRLNPKFTVLISSMQTRDELRFIYKIIGNTGILKIIPAKLFVLPSWLAIKLFGAKNNALLKEILNDTDPYFTKWALNQLVSWKNKTPLENGIKLNGDKDLLVKYKKSKNTIKIVGGGHFMIVDKAKEISEKINEKLNSKS